MHISRKNDGRRFIGYENSVKSEKNSLGWYVKNNIKPLLAAAKIISTITNKERVDPKYFKKTKEEQRENEWTEKRMHR